MKVIDFEVFKEDWLCVIVDLQEKTEQVFVNDRDGLSDYYEQNKTDLFIGFNIREYDQFIFKAILCGFNPKDVNDYIIVRGEKGYSYSRQFQRIPLNIFDIMPNPPIGLKTLEGFMGSDIRESGVPFDIDRKLTAAEISEVISYCRHDVEQTIEVLDKRLEELTSHIDVVKMFDMPKSNLGRTKAQLSAMALNAQRRKPREDELDYTIVDTLRIKKYQHIVDWFIQCRENASGMDLKDFYKQKLEVDVAGVPHVFAWGGIHGALPKYRGKGFFVNVDVASYYPSMMIEYNFVSRNISDPKHFEEIYKTRLEYKAAKDKRANPLKIVLNSTYGAMKDMYNPLYDPLMANNVCVTGQLLLLDLIEHLEPHFDIIQSNTDGVLVKLRAETEAEANREYAKLDDICHEWECRSGMVLEFDEFAEVIQRDVNNYLIVSKDKKYKSKGAVVKKLSSLDYDLPIVNKAVVNALVYDIPVEKTIGDCDDLIDYQKIFKVSRKYSYAVHNGKKLSEKTFRVFASKDQEDTPLYKCKKEGSTEEKFALCPENCFIMNESVSDVKVPKKLNKQWYVDLAKKRIREFIGE